MKKFREAIADALLGKNYDRTDGLYQFDLGNEMEVVDQLFAIREESCRLAIVKDCEMPCMFDGKGKEKGAIQYRREMGANIVQEEDCDA